MMQAAESREGPDEASRCGWRRQSARWRVLREPKMRPIVMIEAHVLSHESLQMSFIENEHVIKQFSSAASYPTFRDAVLPRAAIGRAHGLASHLPHGRNHILAELGIVIKEQELVRRRIRPPFSQLLHDPERVRLARHAETQNLASVVANNKEAIQHAKSE